MSKDSAVTKRARWKLDRSVLIWIALTFAVWRLVIHSFGLFAEATLAPDPSGPERAARQGGEIWLQWDATYYVYIANDGYVSPSLAVFFPLFPLAMRAGRKLADAQIPTEQIGMLINLVIVPAAMAAMYYLTKHHLGQEVARRSVVYLLLFPTALFLAVPYTEALFLLLVISAFLSAEKQFWPAAGVLGALAAATRLTGVLLLPCLLLIYLTQRGWRRPGLPWMWLGVIPLGIGFHGWMLERSGYDWWMFLNAAELGWPERQLSLDALGTIATAFSQGINARGYPDPYTPLVELGALLFAAILGFFVWKLLPKAYFLFVALLFVTTIATRSLIGANRYVLGMFPLFMALAYLGRNKLLDRSYVAFAGLGLGLFTAMFVTGYWVA